MPMARPTLPELNSRIQVDIANRLGLVEPHRRNALVRVIARVVSSAAHLLHGHAEHLSKQIFPDQAERANVLRMGALLGVHPTPAAYATGLAGCTGTNGQIIRAGTLLRRQDGAVYKTNAEVEVAAGQAILALTAVAAGEAGNCDASTKLSFESPISGVSSTAEVGAYEISGGSDEEPIDYFRLRVLARMAYPPHGGSADDYVAWAKEVPGVTRAWCSSLENGDGTVVVRFVRDNDTSDPPTSTDLIPDAGEIETVRAHIDGETPHTGKAPATATVTVVAPTPVPLNFEIHVVPDATETRAAVEASLRALLLTVGCASFDHNQRRAGGTVPLSKVHLAIGTTPGVTDYTLTAPATHVFHDVGKMPVMGDIAWT
ncbi:MAG TPA: baseplate J/gp47 family protein [Propionicimonas sp.]|jgi:uncharacterized phage protein gp47/JayE